jgi:26S proteasome regulatory subunit N9
MAIASLIGEKMFNFAELMEKDFFKLLLGSQFEFIYYLILCFNSAKVDQFIDMMENNKARIQNDPILSGKIEFLHTKVRVAALLELVFQKNKNERVITYKEINHKCLCDIDKIEFLVIKALSLGLIKGYIDEVYLNWLFRWKIR